MAAHTGVGTQLDAGWEEKMARVENWFGLAM
jgi:hypothetical protein